MGQTSNSANANVPLDKKKAAQILSGANVSKVVEGSLTEQGKNPLEGENTDELINQAVDQPEIEAARIAENHAKGFEARAKDGSLKPELFADMMQTYLEEVGKANPAATREQHLDALRNTLEVLVEKHTDTYKKLNETIAQNQETIAKHTRSAERNLRDALTEPDAELKGVMEVAAMTDSVGAQQLEDSNKELTRQRDLANQIKEDLSAFIGRELVKKEAGSEVAVKDAFLERINATDFSELVEAARSDKSLTENEKTAGAIAQRLIAEFVMAAHAELMKRVRAGEIEDSESVINSYQESLTKDVTDAVDAKLNEYKQHMSKPAEGEEALKLGDEDIDKMFGE